MKIDDLVLVSVDDHVVEPPDMFERHLPAAYRDKGPRVIRSASGDDMWEYEGQLRPNVGLNAVAGRSPDEYGFEPTSYSQMRRGCFDVHERVRDMNANGVLASMCFGSFPSFCGLLWARAKDKALAHVVQQAYNDWHIDDWCAASPGRFIPLAQLPLWDIGLMAGEVRRVARKGCHAVTFVENPTLIGLPSIHDPAWDPLWKACCDEQVVLAIHIGSVWQPAPPSGDSAPETMMAGVPVATLHTASDFVFSPVFRRFPALRIALSEGGIGWIPYFLERIDYLNERHHRWTRWEFAGERPSDVFRRHFLSCFIDDATGIRTRDVIGVDAIAWECDYPHSDSTWPEAPERLMRSLAGLPDDEIDRITHQNALRWFHSDALSAVGGRDRATVGALRAQARDVDLSLLRGKGGKPPADDAARPVTARDILAQLATALDGNALRGA
jgi:predicted TIM-barrel fold metal-dependent hydrolase